MPKYLHRPISLYVSLDRASNIFKRALLRANCKECLTAELIDCRNKAMTCNDFRAIAISPILCKVFEYCLLDKCSNMLKTSDTQSGFKKGLSYNHAIYSVGLYDV